MYYEFRKTCQLADQKLLLVKYEDNYQNLYLDSSLKIEAIQKTELQEVYLYLFLYWIKKIQSYNKICRL